MTDAALLRRIDRIESTLAIQQLPTRYARAVDSRDVDTWVNLFVEDVRVTREKHGREEMRKFIENAIRGFYRSIHYVCGHTIDFIDDDNARGTVYCRAEHEDRGKWIVMGICYFDRYERRNGTWYFRKRNEQHWYSADALERPNDGDSFQRWPGHDDAPPALPSAFETWKGFWDRAPAGLVNQLTRIPV
ncbi:MAG: nuclear transport factor 2 family protein [Gammaproteobacteria bacterium]